MERQRASGRAAELAFWERYGVQADRIRGWHEQAIKAVTRDQVRAVLTATLGKRPGVRVVTRPTG